MGISMVIPQLRLKSQSGWVLLRVVKVIELKFMAKLMKVPPPPEDGVQLVTPKERLDKQIVSKK